MATRGGFAAWTERAKDVIVDEIKSYLSLNYANVLKEMPQIERYGLAGQTTAESFVNVFTALPHREQRIPFVAIMSAPGTERKMGIGRQVVATFHDPDTGLPTVRECVGGDLNVVIEIAATDTNMRSEVTDIIYSFFTMYMEQTRFSFLGDGTPDAINHLPQNYQLIIKSQASLGGETDQPRPEGEPFNRIYFNRITVPIIFLDYVDREADDISICYNPFLLPEDDDTIPKPLPFPEPDPEVLFATHDDFEDVNAPNAKWRVFTNFGAVVGRVDTSSPYVIRGTASVLLQALDAGAVAVLSNRDKPTVSGRLRARHNLLDGAYALVLYCIIQGSDPFVDPCYHVIVKNGSPSRIALMKGVIGSPDAVLLGEGSKVVVPTGTKLAAQLEWKIDLKGKRVRLRAYTTKCDSLAFGELVKRLELIDSTDPYLTTEGEGFGFEPNPDVSPGIGAVVVDDVEVLAELNVIAQSNPAKVG
jgi:hypothetical protein